VPTDYLNHGNVKVELIVDGTSPPDAQARPAGRYGELWGIFEHIPNAGFLQNKGRVRIRQLNLFPAEQAPVNVGLHAVGPDGNIAAGLWKSGQQSTDTNRCYWARLDPASGRIRQNHFGIAGMTVRLYSGDVFETNEYCTPWFYVGP
jgi:hypothetical protein